MHDKTWTSGEAPWWPRRPEAPRIRVVVDNDFAGDPDDVFQLAHHLLSPSAQIPLISCSRLPDDDPLLGDRDSTELAEEIVRHLLDVMRLDFGGVVRRGSPQRLISRTEPRRSPAAEAIIAEALRDDTELPLYVVMGGGLTELASAWLLEPRIAQRVTVIWIGGPTPDGLLPATDVPPMAEYNFAIDPIAAQVVLNDSDLVLWQVPREAYRQCLVSEAELLRRCSAGPLGRHLYGSLGRIRPWATAHHTGGFSETYALGDSPLVLLTVLQSFFEPDVTSSEFAVVSCSTIDGHGRLTPRPDGRPVRVFTRIDTRVMFEDMFTKIEFFDRWLMQSGRGA